MSDPNEKPPSPLPLKEDDPIWLLPDDADFELSFADPLPSEIGNYRIIKSLGSGAMGAVYEAEHVLLGKRFALKILTPDRIPNQKMIDRFRREANAIAELDQRSLLRIYEFGIAGNGQPFLVTDLFAGEALSSRLERHCHQDNLLAVETIAQITLQAAEALAHAHERGVIHRDIKPSNILIKQDPGHSPEVKIIDFGIAKIDEPLDPNKSALTATGELLGTPRYMSPEQCQGQKLDRRSDVYSLGCVLYEMVAGRPPFTADGMMQIMIGHIEEAPPPIQTSEKNRKSLEAIALKCLEKSPEKRYQSMDEIVADLNSAMSGVNIKPKRTRRRNASSFASRLKIYIPLCITAVGLAFAAGYYELWAPGVVLYTDLPAPVKNAIMDPAHAQAILAVREANRLRLESLGADGVVDTAKLKLAEDTVRPHAKGSAPYNVLALNTLAEILATEGKLEEVQQICRQIAGGDGPGLAQVLHNVAVSIDHRGFHAQALPIMQLSLDQFLRTIGPDNAFAVKESYNIATAKYNCGQYKEALADLLKVRPQVQKYLPQVTDQCDQLIRALQRR